MGEYVPSRIPERIRAGLRRETLKPLHISQPEGPSFTLDGNLLQWQNWALRIGFNHREGMTLHTVRYRDGDRNRSVAHRLSFAEMIVPYRDPSEDHYRRTAFDIGEWGLGFMTTSLELGCDCLGEIRYLDAVLHNSKGEPYTITNAICIHEEDNAVLWKHVDHDIGRRGAPDARLTISFHVTVANYEYLVYWRLYQDGNIECEIRATGIMVTTPVARGSATSERHAGRRTHVRAVPPTLPGGPPRHGHRRQRQHRLHDGVTRRTDRPGEPTRAFARRPQRAAEAPRARQAGRQLRDPTGWKVVNTNVVNGLGTHPSYKLVPSGAIPPMFDPESPVVERARVIGHTLWVTPNRPDERWPAGEFVNQSTNGHRAGPMDDGQQIHREHRCGDVVRVRHPPHHPARGLAGDAR